MKKLLSLVILSLILVYPQTVKSQAKARPLKIGVIGLSHSHVGWILRRPDKGDIKMVGIVESNRELAQRRSDRYGFSMDIVYDSIEEMLDATHPDAVNKMGTNVRYIATDNLDYRTRSIYEIGYSQRGAMELRIKEHKTYLKSDRTSCHKFEANQLRLFMHSVAYVLMHTMQKEVLKGTEFVNSTMKTLQLKVLKTAAKVKELKTKIKIEFPKTFALRDTQTTAFKIFETVRC